MLLSSLVGLPLFGAAVIALLGEDRLAEIRKVGLLASGLTFFLSLLLWVLFDSGTADYQFVYENAWLSSLNINLILGVDGISVLFVILTTLMTPICLLASWDLSGDSRITKGSVKLYWMAFLVLEALVIFVFVVLDLLLFYVGFEAVLLPMFFLIGI
jgi:NADH-quinone oxidoreductase subunit M